MKTLCVSLLFVVGIGAVAAHWFPAPGYFCAGIAWFILLCREGVEE